MAIRDKIGGAHRPQRDVHNADHLADVRIEQARFTDAEALLNQVMGIRKIQAAVRPLPNLLSSLHSFGRLRERQGRPCRSRVASTGKRSRSAKRNCRTIIRIAPNSSKTTPAF